MMEFVNGKDDIPYIMETKKVPSHQPVMSFDPWKDDSDRKRMLDSVSIVVR